MTNNGLAIPRLFTVPGVDPLDEVIYERRSSVIADNKSNIVFKMEGVEVPVGWSQIATDILASKYCRKTGVGSPTGCESSARQVVSRIARTIRRAGDRFGGYFASEEDANAFEAELSFMLINQYGAFNSPVWFNCGLHELYGIKGGGDTFAWDFSANEVVSIENSYTRPPSAACYINNVEDDLMKIYDLAKTEAKLFKYGSGTGSNMSPLRSKHEKLSGGGLSSGVMSFLKMFDTVAGSTKSGGTTRRAAVMRLLDMDHPEIVDFIQWKQKEEKKAQALIAAGYPRDFNGEAYMTVGGQNSNNSVRVSDGFMHSVINDYEWLTTYRTTGKIHKTYQAKDLWNLICEAAWSCADPGMQYDTTINKWNTCPNTSRLYASNPCGEFHHLPDTSCNLSSLNLVKFIKNELEFNWDAFRHSCTIFTLAKEILVDLSSYPIRSIAKNSHDYRPLGLGYANLGSLLMILGMPYDSEKGRSLAACITSCMSATGYKTSALIAASKGPFNGFEANRDAMLAVIAAHGTNSAINYWSEVLELGRKFGFRNSQISVIAPTGTIGLLMDCDTTGVEPDFSLVKYKKLAGGGSFKIVNQSVARALSNMGYLNMRTQAIIDHIDKTETIEGAPYIKEEHLPIFDCANRCGTTGKRFLSYMAHLKMMAAVQPFISGAISKTINLPNEATVDDVSKIYEEGWRLGLKAIALYRDGCKASQPLSTKKESSEDETVLSKQEHRSVAQILENPPKLSDTSPQNLSRPAGVRVRLPTKRLGFTQEARVGGHKIFLRTGQYEDGTLGEIFIDMHKEGAALRSIMGCFAMSISIGLQYGVPLSTYVEQFTFTNFEPNGIVEGHPNIKMAKSMIDYIFRVLGIEYLQQYDLAQIKPGERYELPSPLSMRTIEPKKQSGAPVCSQCGHLTTRDGACYRCSNCGTTTGCS